MTPSNSEVQDQDSLKSKLGALLFLAGIFFLNFLARFIPAPLMPTIEKDLGITHGQAGSLFLMIYIGYSITLVGAGFISARVGHRATIIMSALALGGAVLLVSISGSLAGIRAGLIVLGGAAGIYLPSGLATITAVISPKHWGKAMAVHELAPNLSMLLAPVLAEALLGLLSWRGILAMVGAASVLSGLAFIRFGPGRGLRGQAPGPSDIKNLLKLPSIYLMVGITSLGIAGSAAVYSMLPLYMVAERGLDRAWANTFLALSRISSLFMSFASGWATDRFGAIRTLTLVMSATALATILLAVLPGSGSIVMIFLQAALSACFFPPALAALSLFAPPHLRSVAVSLTIPPGILIGIGLMPVGIGFMGDIGAFDCGLILTGVLILVGPVLVRFLRLERG